jgi:DNA-binding MarR family transcriptional regulator
MNSDLHHQYMYTSKLVFQNTHEQLEKIGLYRGQPPMLFELWKQDGLSRKELAEKQSSTPATITKMIKRLEKTGFVVSRPDAIDGRISRVYLTDKGQYIKDDVEEIFKALGDHTFKGFSQEEKEQLSLLLSKINNNLKKE